MGGVVYDPLEGHLFEAMTGMGLMIRSVQRNTGARLDPKRMEYDARHHLDRIS